MRSYLAILIAVAVALIWLLLPGVSSGPIARTAQCRNNLKQIALALENYHSEFGNFPPVYVTSNAGKPLYSWRVLLLPYLDHAALYDEFDLSQAWDVPHNKRLSDVALDIYRCPVRPRGQQNEPTTNYLAVIGPNCAWRRSGPLKKSELNAETILLVEVADSQTPWAKPEDFELSELPRGINTSDTTGISSHHCRDWTYAFKQGKPGANVLFVDGRTKYLLATHSAEDLRAMLRLPDGKDALDESRSAESASP